MRETIELVRSGWRATLLGAVAGVLAGVVLVLVSPSVYGSTSTVYLSAVEGGGEPGQAYQGSMLAEQKARSYAELFSGDRLRSDVERILGGPVAPGAVSAIAQSGTSLLTVEARASTPEGAVGLARAVETAGTELVAELERPRDPLLSTVVTLRTVTAPSAPVLVAPDVPVDVGGGLLAGAALGLAYGLVRRRLRPTVRTRADLAQATGDLPFLGTVCAGDRTCPATPGGPRDESVRLLRTALQHAPGAPVRISTMLTGPGSSALACDLATAYGATGRRVVLVDADLRTAAVTTLVGWDRGPGLADVLGGSAVLDDVLRPWAAAGIDVLSAGGATDRPSELLDRPALRAVLASLAGRYDVVLVDAPAADRFADPSVLAPACDGTLLVARHGTGTAEQVAGAVEALERVAARLVGTVLCDVPAPRGGARRSPARPPATGARPPAPGGPGLAAPIRTRPAELADRGAAG